MIEVKECPVCGANHFSKVFNAPFFRGAHEEFSVKECTNCGFWLTSPRPEDEALGGYYEQENYVSHSDDSKSLFDQAYKIVRSYALTSKKDLVSRLTGKGAKVLDYGAGGGAFVKKLKEAGFDASGVEPSEVARENALKQHGISLLPPESWSAELAGFDAITLWHVLEHLPDLNGHVEKFKKALKPGGVLIIAVPNHESYDARYYAQNWAAMDVPLHLWHFKKRNIEALAKKHGLLLKEIVNMPFDSFYVSLLSEKVKGSGNPLNAVWRGLLSNMKAGKDNASSLIYVLENKA